MVCPLHACTADVTPLCATNSQCYMCRERNTLVTSALKGLVCRCTVQHNRVRVTQLPADCSAAIVHFFQMLQRNDSNKHSFAPKIADFRVVLFCPHLGLPNRKLSSLRPQPHGLQRCPMGGTADRHLQTSRVLAGQRRHCGIMPSVLLPVVGGALARWVKDPMGDLTRPEATATSQQASFQSVLLRLANRLPD